MLSCGMNGFTVQTFSVLFFSFFLSACLHWTCEKEQMYDAFMSKYLDQKNDEPHQTFNERIAKRWLHAGRPPAK